MMMAITMPTSGMRKRRIHHHGRPMILSSDDDVPDRDDRLPASLACLGENLPEGGDEEDDDREVDNENDSTATVHLTPLNGLPFGPAKIVTGGSDAAE